MIAILRPIGDTVAVHNGRRVKVPGAVVGYSLVSRREGWVVGYIVRLAEGCDTSSGLYLREVAVTEDDFSPS